MKSLSVQVGLIEACWPRCRCLGSPACTARSAGGTQARLILSISSKAARIMGGRSEQIIRCVFVCFIDSHWIRNPCQIEGLKIKPDLKEISYHNVNQSNKGVALAVLECYSFECVQSYYAKVMLLYCVMSAQPISNRLLHRLLMWRWW